MITLRATASYGNGGKQFIARVTGRNLKYTFERQFVGRKGGKRNEDCEADLDEPGLYEVRNIDRKGNVDDTYVVLGEHDGSLRKSTAVHKEEALKIAKALGSGRRIEQIVELVARPSRRDPAVTVYDAVIVTAREAEKKAVAQTIDAATAQCWQVLQCLPEREAKKVLAALRAMVSPPKPAEAMGMIPETPVGIVTDANKEQGVPGAEEPFTPTPTDPAE